MRDMRDAMLKSVPDLALGRLSCYQSFTSSYSAKSEVVGQKKSKMSGVRTIKHIRGAFGTQVNSE
jgi:hypothetical protein